MDLEILLCESTTQSEEPNFSKIPRHALPPKPEWVEIERKKDRMQIPSRHQQVWTTEEDRELLRMAAKGIYQKDIGIALNRPTRGVQKRLAFLREKEKQRQAAEKALE